MMKYLKILLLSLMVVGLMTGSAFAAASLNAGNTTLAAEKIPPATDYAAAAVNTAYQPAGPVAASTVIKISLTNGNFTTGSTLSICSALGVGYGTSAAIPAGGASSATITLTSPLASGTVYTIQDDACVGFPVALSNINVAAGSPAGTTVSMTVDNNGTPGDPNVYATGVVINVVNQFTAALVPVTSKLDFATTMKTFIADATPLTGPPNTPTNLRSDAAIVITSNEAINDKVTVAVGGGTACTRVLGAADNINFKITGGLAGIANIKYGPTAGPAQTYTITAADRTNGYATLNVTGLNLLICYSTDTVTTPVKPALELTAQNTLTSIAAGTRTAQITLRGGTNIPPGYSRDLIAAGTASHIIQLNATQYYIPLVKAGNGMETYIKLQSKSTVSGGNGVSVAILASDGSVVTVTPTISSITSGTPYTITGTELASLVSTGTPPGKTVDGETGFAAIITVNALEEDVFCYANTHDASNQWKRIPVKTVKGTIVE